MVHNHAMPETAERAPSDDTPRAGAKRFVPEDVHRRRRLVALLAAGAVVVVVVGLGLVLSGGGDEPPPAEAARLGPAGGLPVVHPSPHQGRPGGKRAPRVGNPP